MADALAFPGSDPPTWRQRRLGLELRRIRESRGLGLHAAARLLGRTESSLSKLENAQRGIRRPALEQILDKYGATDPDLRESLFMLARDAKKQGWWQAYERSVSPTLLDYLSIEEIATLILTVELILIPGIFQTPEYARAVISAGPGVTTQQVEELASVRVGRQQRALHREGEKPRLQAVISEAALRLEVGGRDIWHRQLRHLLTLAELPTVEIRVLPFNVGAHASTNGSFTMMEAAGLWIAIADILTKGIYIEEPAQLRSFSETFYYVASMALPPTNSMGFIERILSDP